ncbi:MAG: hypothetical protein AAGC57_20755 [Pseudomonadota bacterium]
MFIKHVIKSGETFDALCKKYGVKPGDWKALWALQVNKAIAAKRKTPEELQTRDVLWFPDRKAEVCVFEYKGMAQVFDKSEWEDFKKAVGNRIAATVVKRATAELDRVHGRYIDIRKLEKEHSIVSWFVTGKSVGTANRDLAFKAVDHLSSTVEARNFGALPKAMEHADRALAVFAKEVDAYVDDYIKGADRLGATVKLTSDVSFTLAGVIAATAFVAATGGGGFLYIAKVGAAVGGATGYTKALTSEIGKQLAGVPRTGGEVSWAIFKKTMTGGVIGFLSGPTGKLISGKIADRLAQSMAQRQTASRLASWLINQQSSAFNSLTRGSFERLNAALGEKVAAQTAEKVLVEMAIRYKTAQFYKDLTTRDSKPLQAAFRGVLGTARGTESAEMVAERVARKMETETMHRLVFTKLVRQHAATLKQIFDQEAYKAESKHAGIE